MGSCKFFLVQAINRHHPIIFSGNPDLAFHFQFPLGFLFNFHAFKALPYTLLLYGEQGIADFGELRHKTPISPCGLVAKA